MAIKSKNIFFIGIKGVAQANLALILKKMGFNVCGSDVEEEFITDKVLAKNGISIINSFSGEAIPKHTDILIYSAAHGGSQNPQFKYAKSNNIKILHQSELIKEISSDFKNTVAVSGCHGKTTTTSIISYALRNLHAKSAHMVGVSELGEYAGGEYHGKDYFIYEADEYAINPPENKTPKLEYNNANYAVITNIDFDHPDVYSSVNDVKDTFEKFIKKVITNHKEENEKAVILCGDDKNIIDIASKIHKKNYLLYGFSHHNDIKIEKFETKKDKSIFWITSDYFNIKEYKFEIKIFGEKNISNASGAVAMLLLLGYSPEEIKTAIKNFTGAKRRFEFIFYENGVFLFDDYAHHPEEILSVISAARERFKNKRIIVIFQPHTFSRTKQFKNGFIQSLSKADIAYLMPVFPSAREVKSENQTTSEVLANDAVKQGVKNIKYCNSEKNLIENLSKNLKKEDVVLTVGAGNIYKLSTKILEIAKKIKHE